MLKLATILGLFLALSAPAFAEGEAAGETATPPAKAEKAHGKHKGGKGMGMKKKKGKKAAETAPPAGEEKKAE